MEKKADIPIRKERIEILDYLVSLKSHISRNLHRVPELQEDLAAADATINVMRFKLIQKWLNYDGEELLDEKNIIERVKEPVVNPEDK